jgi:DHA3 family tetracycline resistance protein-like MFS transporter
MDEAGEERGEHALLRAAQFAPIGSLTGIALGASLAAVSLRIPYFVAAAGMVIISLALLATMRETNFTPTPKSERGTFHGAWQTFRGGLDVVRGRTVLVLIMLISVGQGLWSEAFDRLWELQFLENLRPFPLRDDLDPVLWFGVINGVGLILGIGVIEAIRRIIRGRDATVLAASLGVSTAAMGIGLATFALAGSFALGVGAYLTVRIIYRMLDPLLVAWLNRGMQRNVRATVISMYGQMNAFGQITGGPVVGLIGSLAGVRTALFVSSLVLIPVVGLYALAVRATRREAAPLSADLEQVVE